MPNDILKEIAAAGGGCAIADGLLNPLETMKVKLQLQDAGRLYYNGLGPGFSRVLAEDGLVQGLWVPGLAATWMRAFTNVGLRIGLYPTMKRFVSSQLADSGTGSTPPAAPTLLSKIAGGAMSGCLGSALFAPIDVVRLRLQAESGTVDCETGLLKTGLRAGHPPRYPSTLGAFGLIAQQDGVLGLWRGAEATIARSLVLSGSQLASYDSLKQWVKTVTPLDEGPALHMSCSLASGLIAQTCIQPIDTLRSARMTGQINLVKMLKQEGPLCLYRGYVVACCRQGPIMLIQMPVVEQLRLALGLDPF